MRTLVLASICLFKDSEHYGVSVRLINSIPNGIKDAHDSLDAELKLITFISRNTFIKKLIYLIKKTM